MRYLWRSFIQNFVCVHTTVEALEVGKGWRCRLCGYTAKPREH
jgi:hypothetical protein